MITGRVGKEGIGECQVLFFCRRSTFAGFIHCLRHKTFSSHTEATKEDLLICSLRFLSISPQSLSWIIVPSEELDCQDLRQAEAIFLLKSSAKLTPSPTIVRSFCLSVFLSVCVFPSVFCLCVFFRLCVFSLCIFVCVCFPSVFCLCVFFRLSGSF